MGISISPALRRALIGRATTKPLRTRLPGVDGSVDSSNRPATTKPIEITLPCPPTSNNLFKNAGKRRILTYEYAMWKIKAAQALRDVPRWGGPYPVAVSLVIVRGQKWMESSDVCNREKATIDALVSNGILASDDCRHVRPVTIDYDPTGSRKVPPVVKVRIG